MKPFHVDPVELTRRQFLARSGTVAAGLTLGGRLLAADGKPAKIVLGNGSHKYECLHDWLVPPDNVQWGDTHCAVEDSKGRLYITHTVHPSSPSGDAIVVFDKKGKFLTSWGSRFRGGGHGIDLRKEDGKEYLYHCDVKHRQVVKTTLDGEVVWEKGLPQEADVYKKDSPFVPTNVAFAPNGDLYIADGYGSSWIHQYTLKGDYIRTFGGRGEEPGKVRTPHSLMVDTRGSEPVLVVADRENHRLQTLALDGKFIKFVTNGMRRPCDVDFRGDLTLVPDLVGVVTLVDERGKVVVQLGDGASLPDLRNAPRDQFVPGKFIHPHGAMFLRNGDILVTEWVPIGRVTLLKRVRG